MLKEYFVYAVKRLSVLAVDIFLCCIEKGR